MFKSVFAKYVTAVMMIFVIGFTVLMVVLTSIVGNSVSEEKSENMEEIATAVRSYTEDAVGEGCTQQTFPSAFSNALGNHPALAELMRALLATDDDMNILIADHTGRVLCRVSGGKVETDVSAIIPHELLGIHYPGMQMVEVVSMDSLYSTDVLLRTCGIYSGSGEPVGYVGVSSQLLPHGRMVSDLSRTVISSILLVLLAAMIAVYFISERVTSPMREMSVAARSFADGKFGARVRVKGQDEVAELAVAFNNMADSLENLEKMRSSFIANISHDLRTPMTTIAGFIEGIRDGVIPPEEHDYYLEVISIEVNRLSRLVTSLLDLSRIQAGDRKFRPEDFDVCEMARLILISFEQKIEEKQLNIEFECDQDRMMTHADHDAIYQVFYNICHNALKFSRAGGTLRISICECDKKLHVAVYNEGQGIPAEDLPHVFERFYKTDKSRGLDKSGVGLGLYISKAIIEAHGEKIWVRSEAEKNCEFTFSLPKLPAPKA
jgi:signal transduction histidine kinase